MGATEQTAIEGGAETTATPLGDPRTYDYSQPTREADIVMKGGVTSGVVYPHAVCELARSFRFRSIGGTSAGAIAAAATAAAERGRASGGFNRLALLPGWIGSEGHLLSLFQPQQKTAKLFRLVIASLNKRWRTLRLAAALLRGFAFAFLLGAPPGVALALIVGFETAGGERVTGIVLASVLALVGGILGLAVALVLSAIRQIPDNGFGLCTGMPGSAPGGAQALTPWLTNELDELAGIGSLLTFAELTSNEIELAMVTTNLTNRKPHRLPWVERGFYFDPAVWRRYFPEEVVAWMEVHPPLPYEDEERERQWQAALVHLAPLRPFPPPEQLPVVVAARLSLSFPLLISAVPLWAIDETRARNAQARQAIRDWLQPGDEGYATLEPERCWFSDGGISTNFPIHFFDRPLPTRPTFAINLSGFHPDHPEQAGETENVWLPQRNSSGLLSAWYRFGEGGGWRAFVGFVNAIARTMQNRVDSALMRQPGYRDRIAHIHLDDRTEGGLNLNMDEKLLKRLTERGQAAGRLLLGRFGPVHDPADPLDWDNHRWVRYRSLLSALVPLLRRYGSRMPGGAVDGETRSYPQLVERAASEPPGSYRWQNAADRASALALSESLTAVGAELDLEPEPLAENTPHPRPDARIVPRD